MNEDVQKNVVDTTENVVEQPTEEVVDEGIELTDTSNTNEVENTEDVEETKEVEEPKVYSEKELNEKLDSILPGKIKRAQDKIRREYEAKLASYNDTENILKAGLGVNDIQEGNSKLRSYYEEQGINIPDPVKTGISDDELELLGKVKAQKILDIGLDDAEDEANELAKKGYQNLNVEEKAMFNTLADALTKNNDIKKLKSAGADESILEDKEFNDYKNQFKPGTDITKIYEQYSKLKPKPKVETIGSMTNNNPQEKKSFYTKEEVDRMTDDEVNKNFDVIRESMLKW